MSTIVTRDGASPARLVLRWRVGRGALSSLFTVGLAVLLFRVR